MSLSPYILDIRNKIGNQLLLLPSVTILVFDEERKVLLVKHSNEKLWVAPGGMIEPDESPETAALREMREETGTEIEIIRILGSFGGPDFRITYENGDEVVYVMTVYEAKIRSGHLRPDGFETLDIGYFSYEQTQEMNCGKWLPTVLDYVFCKVKR
jgi:8-oxo-dGTP pyrophosphatase MutT (NUDIX family)